MDSDPNAETILSKAAISRPSEQPGAMIGRYKLLEPLGEGGMGTVWIAEQREPLVRRVALKIIKAGMDTAEVVARFEQERQALALMDHPCVAKVFDAGTTDNGRPFFVMELVTGVPLTAYCDEQKPDVRARLGLFILICQAIQHAHQKGIIHRDLKPSNILVTAGDDGSPRPKVIDFGIAKATGRALTDRTLFTQLAQIIGTPAYMSPEQAGTGPIDIDTRSDIYSLGVLLYELLTGRPPFDPRELASAGFDEMRRVIREKEPPRPSTRISSLPEGELTGLAARCRSQVPRLVHLVRGDLDWIVMKALEKNRNRRYESAAALAQDVQRHMENQPVMARPPGKAYLLSRFVRRHRIGFAAGAAVTLALVAGIATAVWGLVRAETARKQAEEEATKANTANAANKANLHRASMADLAGAAKIVNEVYEAKVKHKDLFGFAEKFRIREAVALLIRSLERDPGNYLSAAWLYDVLRHRTMWKSDLPLLVLQHEAAVKWAGFDTYGKKILTLSDDRATRVWDSITGHLIARPMRHSKPVRSTEFSPNGTKVVTASEDHTAQIWDAATGHPLGNPLLHAMPVNTAKFSPDSSMVVTASDDGTAQVWEVTTGRATIEPMRHQAEVLSAVFSPDGTRVLTASKDNTARVWEAATGHAVGVPIRPATRKSAGTRMQYAKPLVTAVFSPDGRKILTASEYGPAQVWDAQTCEVVVQPIYRETVGRSAVFGPDGTRVVAAGWGDSTVEVGDVVPGKSQDPLSPIMLHRDLVLSTCFSPEGGRVLTASADGTARVVEPFGRRELREPMRHNDVVFSASFSPDGTRVITASHDKTARVWEASTSHISCEPDRSRTRVRGGRLTTVGKESRLSEIDAGRTRDTQGEAPVEAPRVNPPESPPLKEKPPELLQGLLRVFGGKPEEPVRNDKDAEGRSFSPDRAFFVTVDREEGFAQMHDAVTGHTVGERLWSGIGDFVANAQFSPDGKRLVSTDRGDTTWTWEVPTKDESRAIAAINQDITAWAGSLAGLRFGESGELQVMPDDERIPLMDGSALPAGPWADLAVWLNTPVSRRTLDVKSKKSLRHVAERERDFNGSRVPNTILSALEYDSTTPLASLLMVAHLEREKDFSVASHLTPQLFAHLRRYDLRALEKEEAALKPEESAALWTRAAKHLLELPPDTKIGVDHKPTTAREEALKAAKRAVALAPGDAAAQEVLKKAEANLTPP